jgi:hypothetical protein
LNATDLANLLGGASREEEHGQTSQRNHTQHNGNQPWPGRCRTGLGDRLGLGYRGRLVKDRTATGTLGGGGWVLAAAVRANDWGCSIWLKGTDDPPLIARLSLAELAAALFAALGASQVTGAAVGAVDVGASLGPLDQLPFRDQLILGSLLESYLRRLGKATGLALQIGA